MCLRPPFCIDMHVVSHVLHRAVDASSWTVWCGASFSRGDKDRESRGGGTSVSTTSFSGDALEDGG